ncbi:MAG: tetratricopeptide repeat protein, partial [Myxococcota bacterium]
ERIYQLLHREFLQGEYVGSCTELDRAFDDGDFNCVTATILYHSLCEQHSLTPVAVATNTHVRTRFLDSPVFDVETTCPDWFDVVRKDRSVVTFRAAQRSVRELTDCELLAKIYYNRAVSLLEREEFEQAIALLRISQRLDPNDGPTDDNLAAGLNNWALAECRAGRFAIASARIREATKNYPSFPPSLSNEIHIHQRWAVALCSQKKFAEALATLQEAYDRRPDVELFDHGRLRVFAQWTAWLLESGQWARATQLFGDMRDRMGDDTQLVRYQSSAFQVAVQRLLDAGRERDATALHRWRTEMNTAS